MIPAAIDDYLGSVLARWCSSVAMWQPPGHTVSETCTCGRESSFVWLLDPARWPHELVHELAAALDVAVQEIEASLPQRDATRIVLTHVSATRHDLVDVLEHCVNPRMRRYAAHESARALRSLEEAR